MEKPILAAMLSVRGESLTSEEMSFLEQTNPLGISLFARNIANKKQIKELSQKIKEVIGRDDVLIAVDQEGGRVRRLTEPEFRSYESQFSLGKISDTYGDEKAKEIIRAHATLISDDLRACGINWNYAPCLDKVYEETSEVLKSRCFGSDEQKIAAYGKIMVDEYCANGILPCIKHIPGHGRAKVDPHLELPVINASLKELEADFYPFQTLKDAPAGMTAHIVIPEIDPHKPITQSTDGIQKLIRGIIGFDGFLISDSIDMRALKGSISEKAEKALDAGCDAVCYCSGNIDEMRELSRSCRFMTDKSMIRFAKIQKVIKNTPKDFDIKQTADTYKQTLQNIEKYDDRYDATEILEQMKKLNNRR